MAFNAIDVETANADRSSICQIGIVRVERGEIGRRWQTLVNPETWCDPWNSKIHGIRKEGVAGSPLMPQIWGEIERRVRDSVLVCHTAFDLGALRRVAAKYKLEQLQVTWLDSARIVRRAWRDEFGKRGYGLKNVARALGIEFRHHDALEDARVAAAVVLEACNVAGLDIDGWIKRVEQPIFDPKRPKPGVSVPVRMKGAPEGPLTGETIVLTGRLSVTRKQAARRAAAAGCDVEPNVTKRTTMLVVGTQNATVLRGYDKSSKHRKAEAIIGKSGSIEILSEEDLWQRVASTSWV